MNEVIDFVVTWVDGSDVEWQEAKKTYSSKQECGDKSDVRYRDWEILKYWFRAIEKHAPWVNKIYFVTCGQKPKWLNEKNSKLVLVNHEEFIGQEYLPTFNSCVIEANLHRIKGLSEKFVYFNDDMFLNKKTSHQTFFLRNKPKDNLILTPLHASESVVDKITYNCMEIINKRFDFRTISKKKMYSFKNGKYLYKNLTLSAYGFNTGMRCHHLPTSFLKSTYEDVWKKEKEKLEIVCGNRFREKTDMSQWIFQFWQLASDNYEVRNIKVGKYFDLDKNFNEAVQEIKSPNHELICLNDTSGSELYEEKKKMLKEVFELRYPEKSKFEI